MPAERFAAIFSGLDRAYGRYDTDGTSKKATGGEKAGGKANTVLGTLTVEMWQRHLDGKTGIGVIPIKDNGHVHWGAIDIDVYDLDIPKLEQECKDLELPLVVCRTKSGGAHLFLFCEEEIKATIVRTKLTQFASALGYVGVEIYPKQTELASNKDVGNWLNMPYFNAGNTNRYALLGGSPIDVHQFLDLAARRTVTEDTLRAINPVVHDEFQDGPPCLQALSRGGFGEGHRNDSLYSIAVYCRAKYGDDWEEVVDKMNREYMQPPLGSKEVAALVKGLSRKNGYFYKCKQQPMCTHCNKELCREREFGIASNDDSPGVMFDGLEKWSPADKESQEKPVYFVQINGRRIQTTAEELMAQHRFNIRCVERLDMALKPVKPAVWNAIVNELLSRVEHHENPADIGSDGRAWILIEQFCTGRAQAFDRSEIKQGKPYTGYKDLSPLKDGDREGAFTFFRFADLARFLDQQRFRDLNDKEIYALIRRKGGFHAQMNIKGTCVQYWGVPAFDMQTEDYDIPPIDKEKF